jgi:hypothetical protein
MLRRRTDPRFTRGVLTFLAALALLAPFCAAATPTEYELKAVFIYKLASYVHWPKQPVSRKFFVIGILGEDPFGAVLDRVVAGERVAGRPVAVRRLTDASAATQCDVLFVSASERPNLRRILDGLGRVPVLTVADMDGFAEEGGMINLTNDERRIRFDINIAALDRAGLKAASQLIALARVVEEAPRRP